MQFKEGCLIDALINGEVDAITHCCNAQGVMGSGLAKQIRERLPEAYSTYKAAPMTLGTNVIADVGEGKRVVNMIAQERYGRGRRQVHYGALAACLVYAANQCWVDMIKKEGYKATRGKLKNYKLGVPYGLASDLAGGDWNIVLELLEAVEMVSHVEVIVYKKGV
jgi:hypothetical protein